MIVRRTVANLAQVKAPKGLAWGCVLGCSESVDDIADMILSVDKERRPDFDGEFKQKSETL